MNEIYNYDPETYHATLTHSVFVRLEGGTLRLSKPNKNISRRASYNETKPEVTYISQKIYDLSDSKVSLANLRDRNEKSIWNLDCFTAFFLLKRACVCCMCVCNFMQITQASFSM